jgi:hypothetical protein
MKRTLHEAVNHLANGCLYDVRAWLEANPNGTPKQIAEEDNHICGTLHGAWLLSLDDRDALRILRDTENEVSRLTSAATKAYLGLRAKDPGRCLVTVMLPPDNRRERRCILPAGHAGAHKADEATL